MIPAIAVAGQVDETDPSPTKPFDPLTSSEQERALDLARQNETVDQALSERSEPIGAALHTNKALVRAGEMPRMATVWIYDYETDRTTVVRVNLDTDAVDRVTTNDLQPPLTAREKHRAGQMALDSDQVRARLAAEDVETDGLDWEARLWTGPGSTACPTHRCALVGFTPGQVFLPSPQVVVDLSADEVRNIVDPSVASSSQGAS